MYISDLVEGTEIPEPIKDAWKWRSEKVQRVVRLGEDGKTRDLGKMNGWKLQQTDEEV